MSEAHTSNSIPLFFVVFGSVVAGCAPQAVPASRPGLPPDWRARRSYDTPHAWIYASSPGAAAEAGRAIDEVAAALMAQGGNPRKGLIVVTDLFDDALARTPDDPRRLSDAAVGPSWDGPSDRWQDVVRTAEFRHWSAEHQLLSEVVRIRPADFVRLTDFGPALPAEIHWVACVPTGRFVDQAAARDELFLTLRDPLRLPFLTALSLPSQSQNQKEWCRLRLFEQLAALNPQWDDRQRQAKGYAYWESLPNQQAARRFGTIMLWP
jgi:hypothetical protein